MIKKTVKVKEDGGVFFTALCLQIRMPKTVTAQLSALTIFLYCITAYCRYKINRATKHKHVVCS